MANEQEKSPEKNKTAAPSKIDMENDMMYKKMKAQEMIKRVKEKIESNDPAVLRTIKTFLDDKGRKAEKSNKKQ